MSASGGMLQFALGLSLGNFPSNAAKAATGLGALLGAGAALSIAISKISQQIERGARFEDLSNRTGVAVDSLNAFARGFQAVGVEGDSFLGVISGLQRSMGGFNELGEPTKDIFAGIGLAVDDLKKKNLPAAFEDVGAALAKLDPSTAANFAGKIFGRGAGGDALQAARNMDEYSGAVKRAQRESALLAKNSGAMNNLGNAAGEWKRQLDSAALAVAAGLTPALTSLVDLANSLDLEGIGHKIGGVIGALGEAVRSGELETVIGLSIEAGVQGGFDFLFKKIQEIPSLLSAAVAKGLTAPSGTFGQGAKRALALLDPTGAASSVVMAQDLAKLVPAAVRGAKGERNEPKERLDAMMAKLAAAADQRAAAFANKKPVLTPAPPKGKPGDDKKQPASTSISAPNDVDALTRLGFFSGGGNGSGRGEWSDIKQATRQTVDQLKNLNAFIARKPHLFDDGGLVNQ